MYNYIYDVVNLVNNAARSKLFTHFTKAFKSLFNHFFVSLVFEYAVIMSEYNLIDELLHLIRKRNLNRKAFLPCELLFDLIEVSQESDSYLQISLAHVVSNVLVEIEAYFAQSIKDFLDARQNQRHAEQ